MDRGLEYSLALKGRYDVSRGSRSRQIFEVLGGLVTSSSPSWLTNPEINLIVTFGHINARILALGPRFGLILALQLRLLRLPGVAIWDIFDFLGELVMSSSHPL